MNFFREIANLIGVPQVYRHISKNIYKLYIEVIASPPETRAPTTQQHTYFLVHLKSGLHSLQTSTTATSSRRTN